MDEVVAAPEVVAAQEAAPAQNVLTQDQVNKIVAREKQRAAESGRRQAEEQYQAQLAQLQSAQTQRNEEVPRESDADAIYKQVQEKFNAEMQERQLKEQMTQVANNYLQKVEAGKKNYTDFDEVTRDFDPTAFPQLTFLLSGIENAGDVLYDLAKNPMKLAGLDRIAEKSPRAAQNELQKLAKSISDNRQAQLESQSQNVAEPLDRLNPSRVSGSNGRLGVRDLRNQDWLRG